jgi:hypothetical protein
LHGLQHYLAGTGGDNESYVRVNAVSFEYARRHSQIFELGIGARPQEHLIDMCSGNLPDGPGVFDFAGTSHHGLQGSDVHVNFLAVDGIGVG